MIFSIARCTVPRTLAAAGLVWGLLASGCFDTSVTKHLPCTSNVQCGAGQTCDQGFCDGPPPGGSDDGAMPATCGDGELQPGEVCYAEPVGFAVGEFPAAIAIGHLDEDAQIDVVTANEQSGNLSVLSGQGDGEFEAQDPIEIGGAPKSVALGDLEVDGDLDIVAANESTVVVVLNSGDGTFATPETYAAGTRPIAVAVGDLDADGDLDIVAANEGSNDVTVLLNEGAAFTSSTAADIDGATPTGIALGAIGTIDSQDTILDIVVGTIEDGVVLVPGNDDGTFGAPQSVAIPVHTATLSPAIGTLNGQAGNDVAVALDDEEQIAALGGLGNGVLSTPVLVPSGGKGRALTLRDVNGDGLTDVAVVSAFDNGVWVLLRTEGDDDATSSFASAVEVPAGTGPNAAVLTELNGDDLLDIITANRGSGEISVLLSDP